jgi:hypothetical protein
MEISPSAMTMAPTVQKTECKRSIDVTGLPEETVRALESLVSAVRVQASLVAPPTISPSEWRRNFDAWMHEVATRARQYPPGFILDDSRESIYEGRGT